MGGIKTKFSFDEARMIRRHYAAGNTLKQLAADYGTCTATLSHIVRGTKHPVLGLTNISRGRGRPRKQ